MIFITGSAFSGFGDSLVSSLTVGLIEIMTVIVLGATTFVATQIREYFKSKTDGEKTKTQEMTLYLIDMITDQVVEYAEAELKGESGREKRDFALKKAKAMLEDHGIFVSEDEILSGIENGVNKYNQKK